jgi:hypothetical protein
MATFIAFIDARFVLCQFSNYDELESLLLLILLEKSNQCQTSNLLTGGYDKSQNICPLEKK